MPSTVLLVDDDPDLCALVTDVLKKRGYKVSVAPSAEAGLEALDARPREFDVVITDVMLGAMSGVELCRRAQKSHANVPMIVMTASESIQVAIDAIRAGAYDFVSKPFDGERMILVVERALGLHALRREVARLKSGPSDDVALIAPALVGGSAVIDSVRELIARIAATDATALITGESGTGKELVARAIHDCSARKAGPFVAINCAAMPESLLEAELFGHVRGAFTDAKWARPGLFVRANAGTILLDEIGEMPMGMQAKLLRALQERVIRPVGGDEEIAFNARIVAATHRNLKEAVSEGLFRQDLFYRIDVMQLHVPPLRARGEDVLVLAQRFLRRCALQSRRDVTGMSPAVAHRLLTHPWPGNVRQLQNCVERAVAVARSNTIALEDLPDDVRDYQPSKVDLVAIGGDDSAMHMPTMHEVECRYIRHVLRVVSDNKTLAAQLLGFDRRTLYRKLDRMSEVASTKPPPRAIEGLHQTS